MQIENDESGERVLLDIGKRGSFIGHHFILIGIAGSVGVTSALAVESQITGIQPAVGLLGIAGFGVLLATAKRWVRKGLDLRLR